MSSKGNFEPTGRDEEYLRQLQDEQDRYEEEQQLRSPAPEEQEALYSDEPAEATPVPPVDEPSGTPAPEEFPEDQGAYGDEAYAVGEPDHRDSLEDLYVRKSKLTHKGGDEEVQGEVTMQEGLSGLQEEPRTSRTGCIAVLVIFFLIIGAGGSTFFVKRDFVDPNLDAVPIALPIYYYRLATMDSETRRLQRLTPDERAYLKTRDRIRDVYRSIYDFQRITGQFPRRVSDFEAVDLMSRRRLMDGWGVAFRLDTEFAEPEASSAGPDTRFNTNDDIVYDGEEWRPPPAFEDVEDIAFFEE